MMLIRYLKSLALFTVLITASLSYASTGFSALVIEPKSGRVLYEYNANTQRYPASITKVMTLYIIFEDLSKGKVSIDRPIKFSQRAAAQEPSKLGAPAGSSISLDLAIKALIVKSANDVAVAVAENLAPNEAAFVQRMNQTARRLGLNNTNFVNPNGLPDPAQVTTAHDLAKLGVAIYNHFPQYYKLFKTNTYQYKGATVTGHNRVNQNFAGADGIKTGYIRKSGFNLLTSAQRGNTRLFAVVLGGRTTPIRDNFMMEILNQSFAVMNSNNRKARITPTLTEDMIVGYVPSKSKTPKTLAASQRTAKPIVSNERQRIAQQPKPTPTNVKLPTIQLTAQPQRGPSVVPNANGRAAIQVGAYKNYRTAQTKARLVFQQLKQGKINIEGSGDLYRARLIGFTRASAETACQRLKNNGTECMVIPL